MQAKNRGLPQTRSASEYRALKLWRKSMPRSILFPSCEHALYLDANRPKTESLVENVVAISVPVYFPVTPNIFPVRGKKFSVMSLREFARNPLTNQRCFQSNGRRKAKSTRFPVIFPVHGNWRIGSVMRSSGNPAASSRQANSSKLLAPESCGGLLRQAIRQSLRPCRGQADPRVGER